MAAGASKRVARVVRLAVAGAVVGVLLYLSPWGRAAEERFGLHWLFALRGPLPSPPGVVLVAIDKASSDRLGVPYDTTRWPRKLHARLVRGLGEAGARTVTFDLHFRKPRDSEDPELVAALRQAGNVVLLEFLDKDQPGALTQADRLLPVILQQRSPPAPAIAAAAAAYGPFTLPKVPDRVSRFWTFDENAGGVASLPLLTLLHFAAPALGDAAALRRGSAHPALSVDGVAGLRAVVEDRLAAQSGAPAAADRPLLESVRAALATPTSRYLNLYGPAQTIDTVPFAEALRLLETPAGHTRFAGKAVFVGVSSPVQWQLRDEFRTVYSDPETGMDLSGSEILASAFANLLDGNSLRPPDLSVVAMVMIAWSVLVALLVSVLRPWFALPLLGLLSVAYLYVAVQAFAAQYLWLPTVVPLLLLAPLLLLTAAFAQHRDARADLARIERTFGHYLPRPLVKRLVAEGHRPLQDRRRVFGVCLVTDAEGYTSVAEQTAPDDLVDLVNDYLAVVIGEIRRHGGEVSDIKGDSVMAFWASRDGDADIRERACNAGTDILAAIDRWNDANAYDVRLPTRIGVHCGDMVLATVGAADHYEQRAVGDIVNTTSRLEQLCKQLGTRMLLSAETVRGVDRLRARNVGQFTVKGRVAPVVVYEASAWADGAPSPAASDDDAFEAGRLAYERGDWERAAAAFRDALSGGRPDPVAAWYLDSLAERQRADR